MAKGFFAGLVRLRNFQLSAWVTLAQQVSTRGRSGADVSLRDVTIARDGKRVYRVRMTSRTGSARRIWGIWRKLVELRLDTKRDGWLSLARGGLGSVSHEMGRRWKNQDRKIVPLSPYVKKPLNSKVIKSFVPELRSRKCFSCFEISIFYMFYVIYIYEHYKPISHIRIWVWYTSSYEQLLQTPSSVCGQ